MAFAYYLFPKEVNTVLQGAGLTTDEKRKEHTKELFDESTNHYEHLDDPIAVAEKNDTIENEPTMVYSQPYPRIPASQDTHEISTPPQTIQVVDATPALKAAVGISTTIILLIIFWLIFSLASIIWSLVCFGKSGTVLEKVVGVVLAVFLGPFYFIYLVANKGYCS